MKCLRCEKEAISGNYCQDHAAQTGTILSNIGTLQDIFKKGKEELICASMGKMSEWLDDYKKAITVMDTFGFTVKKLEIEMGLPPKVQTSLLGSIENIQTEKVNKLIEQYQGEALLVALFRALVLIRQVWECLDLKLTGVILNITLGVPPKIDAEIF